MPHAAETGDAAPKQYNQQPVLRKLGHLEVFHSAWHTLRHLLGVVVACRYVIPQNNISQARIVFEHAIAKTILDHPMLRVGILDARGKKPKWIRLDKVDLSAHLDWQTIDCASEQEYEDKLQAIIDHHHDTEFTKLESRPGWRMTLLQRRIAPNADTEVEPFIEAVFAWNHANFDGMSGKMFHETLLANLNIVASSPGQDTGIPLKDHVLDLTASPLTKESFTPPMHDITKLPITPGFTVKTAWKEFKPSKTTEEIAAAAASKPTTTKPSATAYWSPIREPYTKTHTRRSHTLDGPALARVLAICRQQEGGGITLTALIHAVCLAALAPLFPITKDTTTTTTTTTSPTPIPLRFSSGSAINFRRFLKPSPPGYPSFQPSRTMANYVSTVDHHFGTDLVSEIRESFNSNNTAETLLTDTTKPPIFKAAQIVKQDLQARLERGTKNDETGLMALIGDWRDQHAFTAKKPRHLAWTLSNIGVLDGSGDQSLSVEQRWKIDKSWFSVGTMITGAVFMVSPIAVKGEGLFLGCTWQDGVVDQGLADQFFSRLDGFLKELGRA